MTNTYDLVVIGTGTAAAAANRCRAAGWRVGLVDHLPFGGTCALRGCDPKKVLVGAAEAIDHARRMHGKGVGGGEPSIDWRARVPDLESLALKAGGIEGDKGRLKLNAFLQSVSNPAVYAAGDAASKGSPLTPVAGHDGRVAATNMVNCNQQQPNYFGVPSVAFTIPPIAAAGLTEEKAREQGLKFRMRSQKASDWYTARRVAEPTYGFKVLIEEGTDHVLGAHLVGPHADEVINVFALAIWQGVSAKVLQDAIFAYPTGASDIGHML